MAQVPQSSIFSRRIINLFAGMAYGSPELPRSLVNANYVCHAIEPTFGVASGKVVNPEIVLCSMSEKHTLIVEAKSGANLNTQQLERYALITSDSLIRRAFVANEAASAHNVLVIGLDEHRERLLMGSATAPSPARVLAVTVGLAISGGEQPSDGTEETSGVWPAQISGIKAVENEFSTQNLKTAFDPLLPVDWDVVPFRFLPVDHESPNWEFASFMLPELISAILAGKSSISVDDLAKSFIENWDFIATDYKNQLLERIRTVLKIAAQGRFSSFISFGVKGTSNSQVQLIIPANLAESFATVRSQLRRKQRDLMQELNSPQIAIVFEDAIANG